jgi:hypothetical protein
MTIRTEYPYQTLRVGTQDDPPVVNLWITYVPLDREQRRCRVFGLLSVKQPKMPGLLQLAWPLLALFTERILREDRAIVALEQAALDAQGADGNQEIFPVIVALRALLRRCGAGGAVRKGRPGRCPGPAGAVTRKRAAHNGPRPEFLARISDVTWVALDFYRCFGGLRPPLGRALRLLMSAAAPASPMVGCKRPTRRLLRVGADQR